MYKLLRNLLFTLPAETSHGLALHSMSIAQRLGLLKLIAAKTSVTRAPVNVMGLHFPNPVGLAAGLDKNADHIDALAALGFGFIEVGTLTPRAQPGNPRPRIFRLPRHQAIINRMGFNNKGIDHALEQIQRRKSSGVLGINIGKNFDTPIENAVADYVHCLTRCYVQASYIAVNLSSPNTPGLRELQFGEHLKDLLETLKNTQASLQRRHGSYVPIAIKIAPDLSLAQVDSIAREIASQQLDAIIATNTTLDRQLISGDALAGEAGGLSGRPLTQKSTEIIRQLRSSVGDRLPIVGVGGIMSAADAVEKYRAGASLLQIYTGFIYKGPQLIAEILEAVNSLQDHNS
jgi:dihydroorotate dehydrogenase